MHITDSDLDGAGCKVLGLYFLEENCKKYYCFQTAINKEEMELENDMMLNNYDWSDYDLILFSDLAPTIDLFCIILKKGCNIIICDHHETTWDLYTKDTAIIPTDSKMFRYAEDKSGCKIFYELMLEWGLKETETIKRFVDLVDTYDLWKREHPFWQDAKRLNLVLYSRMFIDGSKFYHDQLKKFQKSDYFFFLDAEVEAYKKAEQKELEAIKKAEKEKQIRKDSLGFKYIYFEAGSKISNTSSYFLDTYADIDYTCCYATFNPEEQKFSLRSRGFPKVNEIAAVHGGGGHEGSAGFACKDPYLFKQITLGNLHPTNKIEEVRRKTPT